MARRPRLLSREARLDALGAFLADAPRLVAEFSRSEPPARRIRSFTEAAPDDIGVALALLGGVTDLGIVVHGPVGCAGASGAARPFLAVTDLDQRDTVLGSDKILAETIRRLDATAKPAAIAVLGSPVVAINNDDIRATVAELNEALGKPVLWVRTDGFRSGIAATGADAAIEALLSLVEPKTDEHHDDFINLLTSFQSARLESFVTGIQDLGFSVNRLPYGANVAALRRAGSAAATLVLDPDLLEPLASSLEERFGVPNLALPLPIGADAATVHRALADLGGRAPPKRTSEPDAINLQGLKLAVALGPAWGLAATRLLGDLGGEVVILSLSHVDRSHLPALGQFAARWPQAQVHVGDGQGFETVNLLKRQPPDVLIGTANAATAALRLGIAAAVVSPGDLVGADAPRVLARIIGDALAGAALARRASRIVGPRYSPQWLNRSPDWHIKLEVK